MLSLSPSLFLYNCFWLLIILSTAELSACIMCNYSRGQTEKDQGFSDFCNLKPSIRKCFHDKWYVARTLPPTWLDLSIVVVHVLGVEKYDKQITDWLLIEEYSHCYKIYHYTIYMEEWLYLLIKLLPVTSMRMLEIITYLIKSKLTLHNMI